MAIDYQKLRSLTAHEIIHALEQSGFYLRRQKGSHQRYVHPDGRRVTVSYHHPSDTFPPKTLKKILEGQAHWSEQDLILLKLMK